MARRRVIEAVRVSFSLLARVLEFAQIDATARGACYAREMISYLMAIAIKLIEHSRVLVAGTELRAKHLLSRELNKNLREIERERGGGRDL